MHAFSFICLEEKKSSFSEGLWLICSALLICLLCSGVADQSSLCRAVIKDFSTGEKGLLFQVEHIPPLAFFFWLCIHLLLVNIRNNTVDTGS